MNKRYDSLFNLNATRSKKLFLEMEYPWEVLPKIKSFILEEGFNLDDNYKLIGDNIWIHKSVEVAKTATIIGPCIIDENTIIRPGAFIRENVLIGKNCVIGNATEIKNAILFDNVQCPHYNYIGDAILGEHSHTGAGVILSNIKNDKKNIIINDCNIFHDTKLKKISAILGDYVEVGCNSVLCPGTIIFPHTSIYPLTRVRGVIEANMIVKSEKEIVEKENS